MSGAAVKENQHPHQKAERSEKNGKSHRPPLVLGSFRLGQTFGDAENQLGSPDRRKRQDDGNEIWIWNLPEFQLVLEKNQNSLDQISAIQIQGNSASAENCLGKICLSSSLEDVLKYAGSPSETKLSRDSSVQYLLYPEMSNLSIEISKGRAVAIKIADPDFRKYSESPDKEVFRFISALKAGDLYEISQHLDPFFEARIRRNAVSLKGSVVQFLKSPNPVIETLFRPENRFGDLTERNLVMKGRRFFNDGQEGFTYRFRSAEGKTVEFICSFSRQGWNISEIIFY